MIKIFFTTLSFAGLFLFSQSHAWYTGNRFDADLLLIETKEDSCYATQALMFRDSVRVVKRSPAFEEQERYAWVPWIFNADHDVQFHAVASEEFNFEGGWHTDSAEMERFMQFGSLAGSYRNVDTVEVEGKVYTIHYHMSDDGFIGGRPNAIEQHIAVSDLGIIYSASNWFNQHTLFMLCHEDTSKQRVLQAVYKHLETRNGWQPWKKLTEMSNRYTFENCVWQLSEQWMSMRSHLQLVSSAYENVGQEIRANITIKNTSDIHYKFPLYFSIAPSHATIHYPDTTISWDLLDTSYGMHMKQMKQEVYLSPGEQTGFSYIFRMEYGCGHCTKVTYEGFQVYTPGSYIEWLLHDPETRLGNTYITYPHREIRPAE